MKFQLFKNLNTSFVANVSGVELMFSIRGRQRFGKYRLKTRVGLASALKRQSDDELTSDCIP